jgi:hypothetical protein
MKRLSVVVSLLALLGSGCVKSEQPPPHKKSAAKPPPAPAAKQVPPPIGRLPELRPPERAPAERVVHVFFTSNADGELDPCG